jgi:hypothetical protein
MAYLTIIYIIYSWNCTHFWRNSPFWLMQFDRNTLKLKSIQIFRNFKINQWSDVQPTTIYMIWWLACRNVEIKLCIAIKCIRFLCLLISTTYLLSGKLFFPLDLVWIDGLWKAEGAHLNKYWKIVLSQKPLFHYKLQWYCCRYDAL